MNLLVRGVEAESGHARPVPVPPISKPPARQRPRLATVSPRLKPAGAQRSDDTTVDQQITAGDERAIGTHQVRGCRANLIWGAATACGGDLHHLAIARPAGRVELVHRQWSEDDAGADRVRSEEHTSELQSQSNLVCRLL